jgi:hypothetical protein
MALESVAQLHQPANESGYDADCVNGTCDHDEDGECPTRTFLVCAHCASLANGGAMWDDWIPGEVMWPCETARALLLGEAALR